MVRLVVGGLVDDDVGVVVNGVDGEVVWVEVGVVVPVLVIVVGVPTPFNDTAVARSSST